MSIKRFAYKKTCLLITALLFCNTHWSKETSPHRGGFPFTVFPHQERYVRGLEEPGTNPSRGVLLHADLDEGTEQIGGGISFDHSIVEVYFQILCLILQKRPIILRSLLTRATPYVVLSKSIVLLGSEMLDDSTNTADGVTTIRRLLQITGLLCKRAL